MGTVIWTIRWWMTLQHNVLIYCIIIFSYEVTQKPEKFNNSDDEDNKTLWDDKSTR